MTSAYPMNGNQRHLMIMEGMTLVLLAVGVGLMLIFVRRIDLQIVLLLVAGSMLGVSTVASMRRRSARRPPSAPRRPFWLWTTIRIMPNLLILVAVLMPTFGD